MLRIAFPEGQAPLPERPGWAWLAALGLAQILSWGSLYYSLAVLALPIREETGRTPVAVFGALTAALLVSGFMAPSVGRWIDRYGGRPVLTAGSLLAALALLMVAASTHVLVFWLGWLLAGLAMACTLYDPLFAVIHQRYPKRARQVITDITLIAGFASTLAWPLTQWLHQLGGWRFALSVYAGANLLLALPVHLLLLGGKPSHTAPAAPAPTDSPSQNAGSAEQNEARFYWLMISFLLGGVITTVFSAFVLELLPAQGFSESEALMIASLIGPMQVAGRAVDRKFGHRFSAARIGRLAHLGILLAMLLLAVAGDVWLLGLLFAVLYGAANGVMTLVRGTVPVDLFGAAEVGRLLGRLAGPAFIARALSPAVFAGLMSAGVPALGLLMLLSVLAAAAWWAFQRATA